MLLAYVQLGKRQGMKKRICVLEDNEGIMDVLSFLFVEEDYEVTGFNSVQKMMPEMYTLGTDVFLLDVMLPDGNGLEICNLLKDNVFTRNTPVVMMSAAAGSAEVRASCSAQDFVTKPFDINDLVKRVDLQVAVARAAG
jgi:DNA-binding response OmpR family regulator